jgi:predicted SnoaL-like aldol condensation-catalyzing enzyme
MSITSLLPKKTSRLSTEGFRDMPTKKLDSSRHMRVVDGVLVEHWDVIQDEATETESRSGLPMFGDKFAS